LQAKGCQVTHERVLPKDKSAIVIGTPESDAVQRLLAAHRITLSKNPESLCIKPLRDGSQPLLLIAGRDARGLSYALLAAARAIELASASADPLKTITEANEEPFLRVRSMTIHPFNADLEEEWYFDKLFWQRYFTLLARCRYNNFTLTFSDQTNYLNPV